MCGDGDTGTEVMRPWPSLLCHTVPQHLALPGQAPRSRVMGLRMEEEAKRRCRCRQGRLEEGITYFPARRDWISFAKAAVNPLCPSQPNWQRCSPCHQQPGMQLLL